jgi:hypothetical protein
MSFDSLLINTCTTRRYVAGIPDAYGNAILAWADELVGEPCRISYPSGKQIQRGTEIVPVDMVLFLNDVNVTEADKVLVDTVEYEILFVARIQNGFGGHHLELSLKRIIS